MISVVIVTKNRHEALRDISLPSLLVQDYADFEVIIWDASEDDSSAVVVASFVEKFKERGVSLSFFRAPRSGMTSQRNDGLKKVRGDVIFFIDDDSEVSADGLSVLSECFEKNTRCMGAGLMVQNIPLGSEVQLLDMGEENWSCRKKIKEKFCKFIGYSKKRTISLGSIKGVSAPPGEAQWLSGCSMAFRREVFGDGMEFNEKLQTFSPYALGEDMEFTHRVFKKFRTPLIVTEKGKVIHRPNQKERITGTWQKAATLYYNRYLLIKVSMSEWPPFWTNLVFFWTCFRLTRKNLRSCGMKATWKGFKKAISEICRDGKVLPD